MQELGFFYFWTQGNVVIRAAAILLLIVSLASWIVIFTKAWDIVCLKSMAQGAEKRFWHSDDLDHVVQTLGSPKDNPLHTLAQTGQEAAQHHRASQPQLHDMMDIFDWITRSLKSAIDEAMGQTQSGLAVLASVGSTIPLVDLFGTVWGIYHALLGIDTVGVPTIDKMAGPAGESLIMVALGLAVAIPAALSYNAPTRGNKAIIAKLNRFAHDLYTYFVAGARLRPDTLRDDVGVRLTAVEQ